ncbi:MAG: hypothetical protein ABSF77_15125 [Spirochaetia bacterium]|jgi:vacuolar-type H+-ATPase subunit H
MEKRQKRGKQELDSLIPTVKKEEKHLDNLLTAARAEADGTVRDAESKAASRVQGALADLPRIIAAERASKLASLRQEAETAIEAEQKRTRTLERAAAKAMDDAVAYIVSLVWPEGRP